MFFTPPAEVDFLTINCMIPELLLSGAVVSSVAVQQEGCGLIGVFELSFGISVSVGACASVCVQCCYSYASLCCL